MVPIGYVIASAFALILLSALFLFVASAMNSLKLATIALWCNIVCWPLFICCALLLGGDILWAIIAYLIIGVISVVVSFIEVRAIRRNNAVEKILNRVGEWKD